KQLEAGGTQVQVVRADVTSHDDMSAVLAQISSTMPPLRGIVNASGIAGGNVLAEQTWESFSPVLDVKVAGRWNLHSLTRDLPLDFFVSFSSAASLLATPGQGSYAAGNAFKDALGHLRKRSGLPGLTVNWGAWAEAGMAASMPALYRKTILHDRGQGEIDPSE